MPTLVGRLRTKLDPTGPPEKHIRNVPNEGYQLTETVLKEAADEEPARDEDIQPDLQPTENLQEGSQKVRPFRKWAVRIAAVLLIGLAVWLGGRTGKTVHLPFRVQQLTDDGYLKAGPIWPTGDRIYFVELVNGVNTLAWVPSGGGSVTRLGRSS